MSMDPNAKVVLIAFALSIILTIFLVGHHG